MKHVPLCHKYVIIDKYEPLPDKYRKILKRRLSRKVYYGVMTDYLIDLAIKYKIPKPLIALVVEKRKFSKTFGFIKEDFKLSLIEATETLADCVLDILKLQAK